MDTHTAITLAQESANPQCVHELARRHAYTRVRWHAVRNPAVSDTTLFDVLMHETDDSVRIAAQETADARKSG